MSERELLDEIERLHQKLEQAAVLSDAVGNILLAEGEGKYPVVVQAKKVFDNDEYKFPYQLFTKREPDNFGEAIAEQRKYRNKTQEEVARIVGLSRVVNLR